jgi:hypothetical protein
VIRSSWLSVILKRFNTDPKLQYKIHIVMTYFWLFNMIACIFAFLFFKSFWTDFSIFYILFVSLYANFATDFGAVPGSEAAISAADLTVTYQKDDLWPGRPW